MCVSCGLSCRLSSARALCVLAVLSLFLLGSRGNIIEAGLLHRVYSDVFKLSDGSRLGGGGSKALDAIQGGVRRLLAVGVDSDVFEAARALPDEELLRILFLAVVGGVATDQSPSAFPQKCALVVDPGSGGFTIKDAGTTQSVILEVLLIVSIVCLLRAWWGKGC